MKLVSVVDSKSRNFHSKYGYEVGQFLLEKLAIYESDYFDENKKIRFFSFIETGVPDEQRRIDTFMEDYKDLSQLCTYVQHPKTNRKFNLLLALESSN